MNDTLPSDAAPTAFASPRRRGGEPPAMASLLAPWLRGRERSLLRRLVNEVGRPGVVSLAGGLPAVELFPADAYAEALRGILADPRSLQYGAPSEDLARRVAELMRRRGAPCRPEEILITCGAQQALDVAARAFLSAGDAVAVERFVYTGIREALAPRSPRLLSLPSSLDDGLDVEALERHLLAGERPRLVYAIPDAHNPLGVSLSREKRERLVGLAHDYDFVILEDDPYGLLCCDGEFEPPLAALDRERVIYAGSFSKVLAPGLRLGWMRRPPELAAAFAAVKEAGDLECSRLTMLAVERLLSELDFEAHLERLRSTYRRRRNAMLEALALHLPAGCAFSEPAGGMFAWVELPEATDGLELLARTMATRGIAFVPAAAFADRADRAAPRNGARLSFSTLEPEALHEAVAHFAACIRGGGAPGP